MSKKKQFEVSAIKLADYQSIGIADKKENKMICYMIIENYGKSLKLAEEIVNSLNNS